MQAHKTVSREEWLEARRALLAKEKAFCERRTRCAAERRELPWVKVDKSYVFDGPDGKETLADLFAGRSQLIVKHFMLGPDWKEGCLGCSFGADQLDGSLVHLINHDVMLVAVSRAPLSQDRRPSRSAWAGTSSGCRRSAATSTSTTTSPSPRRRRRRARSSTISRRWTT